MNASLRKRFNALKRDRIHGAGQLTGQALDILLTAAQESQAGTEKNFLAELTKIIVELKTVRPGMVSIANYMTHFQEGLAKLQIKGRTSESLKMLCIKRVRSLSRHYSESQQLAAQNAAKRIDSRSIVITCSYSSAVQNTMFLAKKNGTDFKVLAIESNFKGISYGQIVADTLRKIKISSQIVPDGQLYWQMARADLVLLGADSISLHGYFINGAPSLELVRTAERRRVPVYLVCELAKVDVHGILAGPYETQDGFDMVPLECMTKIFTESGPMEPEDIYQITKEEIFRSIRARSH